MAIITTGNSFNPTDTVTSVELNNIANAATFDDPVDGTSLELKVDGKLGIKDAGVSFAKLADVIDDDTMGGATDTTLATSESIKAYVDDEITSNGITQTTGTAPYYGCRAFGSFDGTASAPMTPISSGNIASIVRTTTGQYTITLTTAMDSVNYCVVANSYHQASVAYGNSTDVIILSPSQFKLVTARETGGPYNSQLVLFSVFA